MVGEVKTLVICVPTPLAEDGGPDLGPVNAAVATIADRSTGAAQVFADAEAHGWFIEAMFLEPVMGEGDPGRAVPRAFCNRS